jgi:hypothetical protein
MNSRLLALPVLGLLGAGLLHADLVREPFSETHPLKAGARVEVDNTNGEITVQTWDRNEIQITGEKQADNADDLKDLTVEVSATPDSVTVKARRTRDEGWLNLFHWNDREAVNFKITVPANLGQEDIHTVNGSVSVVGGSGAVSIRGVNGSIRAADLGGNASISTVNGTVKAQFKAVSPGGKLAFSSVNGTISVVLPRSADVDARTSTVNGHVSSAFPINSREGGGNPVLVTAHTVNGTIRLMAEPDQG